MESASVILKIIISAVFGVALGFVTIPLAKKLALSRAEDPAEVAPLNKPLVKASSVVLALAGAFGVVFTAETPELLIRNLLFLIPVFALSYVDAVVRKIPNSCLLSILVVEAVYAIYYSVHYQTLDIIPKMFVGILLGTVVCIIPGFLKIPMGAGDVKYNGVIGICLYAVGYFQSMILMALFIGIFAIYLKITKKGGLKTMAPMGPFLSAGMVISMCVSFVSMIDKGLIFGTLL